MTRTLDEEGMVDALEASIEEVENEKEGGRDWRGRWVSRDHPLLLSTSRFFFFSNFLSSSPSNEFLTSASNARCRIS